MTHLRKFIRPDEQMRPAGERKYEDDEVGGGPTLTGRQTWARRGQRISGLPSPAGAVSVVGLVENKP